MAAVRTLGQGYPLTSVTGVDPGAMIEASGAQVIMDWFLKAMLDGHGFQIRAGTVSTPLVGDAPITDTRCEWCADPIAGYTILPTTQIIAIRLATGTLHEYATKSVASASSAGTAFVPLALLPGGPNCTTTARVQAHAVTVTAELATTTRRHDADANPAAGATGALPTGFMKAEWTPRTPPPIRSTSATAWCLYTQIAATSTGPSYYGHQDFLEFASQQIGL